MTNMERIIFKLTSGRFIWTIIMSGVFAYLACTGILETDRVMEILLIGIYAYFTRTRTMGNE